MVVPLNLTWEFENEDNLFTVQQNRTLFDCILLLSYSYYTFAILHKIKYGN